MEAVLSAALGSAAPPELPQLARWVAQGIRRPAPKRDIGGLRGANEGLLRRKPWLFFFLEGSPHDHGLSRSPGG